VVISNEDNVLQMIALDRVPALLYCMVIRVSASVKSEVEGGTSDVAGLSDTESFWD
jgi:hypothetical protein